MGCGLKWGYLGASMALFVQMYAGDLGETWFVMRRVGDALVSRSQTGKEVT